MSHSCKRSLRPAALLDAPLYVTHNVAEAVYLADPVVVLALHPWTVNAQVPIRMPRPRNTLSVVFLDCQKKIAGNLGAR